MSEDPIGEVIAAMTSVRAGLARHDGLGVFIDVYRRVTEHVRLRVADGAFTDPRFVEHLSVVFAGIFLEVPAAAAAGRAPNHAWQPLVERRGRHDLLPIQFALAGMNAHINRDLAVAVVRTCQELGVSPHAAGMGSLLVANTSIGPEGVFTVRTMAPSPCRVFGAAGRNESCRGWRGETCANHVTPSATTSHCSQYSPGHDGASSRPATAIRPSGATGSPSSVRIPS